MSSLRTIVTGCAVAMYMVTSISPVHAETPRDQAQAFANCIGRYTALRDHGWLIGQNNPVAETRRALFEDLLEAVLEDARRDGLSGPELLNTRISAKLAQSRLLHMAQMGPESAHAARAQAMAYREMRACDAMVLGS
ncbi:MAG: hypothetical protein QNJ09_16165 [Paracoccaceae bacterium]|nr:hypothetical protein [Paracoccaceae bacterium]